MSNIASFAFSSSDDEDETKSRAADPGRGGGQPVKWQVVAETSGVLPAQVIAGSLEAAGIPVRVGQESVGRAYGFTVGPLGTGYVAVPEERVEEALALLEEDEGEFPGSTAGTADGG